jgi:hypothetical protein
MDRPQNLALYAGKVHSVPGILSVMGSRKGNMIGGMPVLGSDYPASPGGKAGCKPVERLYNLISPADRQGPAGAKIILNVYFDQRRRNKINSHYFPLIFLL